MIASYRILVVEDDPSILLGLKINLEAQGYEVLTAVDGCEGLEKARSSAWDLIIADIMMPKMNGFEMVQALRSEYNRTPILVLSARTAEEDKIMGLDLGADDYVTKPFSVRELLARVRASLRRKEQPSRWRFDTVEVCVATREVLRDGSKVELTPTEFDVLVLLLRADGSVLTREQIMTSVWGEDHYGTTRTIDNFLAQLRSKLELDPSNPKHLLTVRGAGYRFAE